MAAVSSMALARLAGASAVGCRSGAAVMRGGVRTHLRLSPRSFSTAAPVYAKKYTQEHEWIELDSDGTTGTIGVSTYAANALGDVVYVELPQDGLEVNKGDTIGAVESVKSASDIMTPVSGTILEGNSALEDKPGTINSSPEHDGWIAKIKVTQPAELDALMDGAKYKEFTEGAEKEEH